MVAGGLASRAAGWSRKKADDEDNEEDEGPLVTVRHPRLFDLEPSPPPEAAPHAMMPCAPPVTPAPCRPRWCYRAGDQVCGPWKLSAYRKWVAEGAIDAWASEHVRVWHTGQTEEEAVPLTQALATRRAQQAAKYGWIQ